jgi:hypothetical protein
MPYKLDASALKLKKRQFRADFFRRNFKFS